MSLNIPAIKKEMVFFLRNQDIISTSDRGVTNTQDTGSLSGDSSLLINKTNVKNIRSIEIDASPLAYGTDYTVDTDYDDSGTKKCKISFTAAQTGAYEVDYDYGSDKIHSDFPRDDLSIGNYPRIAVEVISTSTEPFGIGGTSFISNINLTMVVYAEKQTAIDNYLHSIKEAIIGASKSFYYMKFVKMLGLGPLINDPNKKDQIMQRNLDIQGMFEVDDGS